MARASCPWSLPATNYLYTGEQFDEHAQHYYLRARCYNPLNGCFNRMDPYAGSPQDPQSLHEYLYCHANPINGIDPTGLEFNLSGLLVRVAVVSLLTTIVSAPIIGYFTGRSIASDYDKQPDALIFSVSFGLGGYSFAADFACHVVIVFWPSVQVYVIPEFEAGTAPLTYMASQRGRGWVGSIGAVWNMKSINDLRGLGFTTTIPFAALKYGKLLFKKNLLQGAMDFITIFATVQRNYVRNKPSRMVVQLSRSTSGPGAVQVGGASTGFAFGSTVGYGLTVISCNQVTGWFGDKLRQIPSIFAGLGSSQNPDSFTPRLAELCSLVEEE